MRYDFKCVEDGTIIEKVFSMMEVPDEFEEDGKHYKRNMGSEFKDKSLHIPDHMKAGANRRIMGKHSKGPGNRKHFY